MGKVNSKFKDYVVYNHNLKTKTEVTIVKSGLTKEQAKELCIKLGSGHGFARQQVIIKLNQKQ
jgi:hypothetical protein